jgi:ABC-type uncharacterized transport system substrate-binding protein
MRWIRLAVVLAVSLALAPLAAEAQQAGKVPRIGFLQPSQSENAVAFTQALRDAGYVDGHSAILETRIYGPLIERLPEIANELAARKCDVILAAGPSAIRAATRATTTIPIVGIDLESDPVANGWARSIGRPAGNLTGLFLDAPELGGKEIQLLKEAVPGLSRIGILWDSSSGDLQFRATEKVGREAGLIVESIPIRRVEDAKLGLDRAAHQHLNGIIVLSSPLILRDRAQITDAALKNRLPTISLFTLFIEAGGLMAYGPDLPEMYKRAVTYIDKILRGAKAGDLPIERPSRFRFVINLKTAKALGLTIPQSVLLRADQVIQ